MTKEDIGLVLKGIQMKATRLYGAKLFKDIGPDKDLMKGFDALIDSDLPKWKRDFYKVTKKDFDKHETVLDEEVAKKQDLFIQREIKKAIKKGLLPKEYDDKTNS
ncbi:hypothetical protein KBA63_02880 [Candidatus Woesebacteria bacterium]|nr:hypothetical protein [Candidatus Woesebacteria bacterium]